MVCVDLIRFKPVFIDSGLTQAELAEKAGVNPGVVNKICHGYLVREDRLGKVCRALGIPSAEVIDFSRIEERKKKMEERRWRKN